jgi:hypothetical protein
MKTAVAIGTLLLITLSWKAADILGDLSLTQVQLEEATLKTAQSGLRVPAWNEWNLYPFVKKAKALPAGSQASAVKSLAGLVKSYVMSDRFKKQWQQQLAEQNIYDPKAKGDYMRLEELRKQEATQASAAAKSQKNATDAQTQMAKTLKEHPEMEAMMKQQMSKEEWAEMQKMMKGEGNKEMVQAQAQSAQGQSDFLRKEEARVKETQKLWDENNYAAMVKLRLKKFIELANSVDFSAELKNGKYGKKEFVNPAYEKKSDLWKQLYRAGKEPVMAARDFAQQWLGEMK